MLGSVNYEWKLIQESIPKAAHEALWKKKISTQERGLEIRDRKLGNNPQKRFYHQLKTEDSKEAYVIKKKQSEGDRMEIALWKRFMSNSEHEIHWYQGLQYKMIKHLNKMEKTSLIHSTKQECGPKHLFNMCT